MLTGVTGTRQVRSATLVWLLLLLAACASTGGEVPQGSRPTPSPSASLPAADDALVLQVAQVGGFVPVQYLNGRLPLVSVYADGRMIVEGPVDARYPGPAWPNVQMLRLGRAEVQDLLTKALAAGVAETTDLGTPGITDVPSTRFTVVTDDRTYVREVYALAEYAGGGPGSGVTPAQEKARARLRGFLDEVTGRGDTAGAEPYVPEAIAAVVTPWFPPDDLPAQAPKAWPGPPLPGDPLGAGTTCVTARTESAQAVLAEAVSATATTPWTGADGRRWSLLLRPLLPHESGCADLSG